MVVFSLKCIWGKQTDVSLYFFFVLLNLPAGLKPSSCIVITLHQSPYAVLFVLHSLYWDFTVRLMSGEWIRGKELFRTLGALGKKPQLFSTTHYNPLFCTCPCWTKYHFWWWPSQARKINILNFSVEFCFNCQVWLRLFSVKCLFRTFVP